jgi:hypothetical protein
MTFASPDQEEPTMLTRADVQSMISEDAIHTYYRCWATLNRTHQCFFSSLIFIWIVHSFLSSLVIRSINESFFIEKEILHSVTLVSINSLEVKSNKSDILHS